jgi:Mg-chelatase subunit ChlD
VGPPVGANIALAALGGRVLAPSEPADRDPAWQLGNLIDGFPLIRGVGSIRNSFGWQPVAELPAFPYEVVLGFAQGREATIAEVVVDTASDGNVAGPAGVPKDVEVWASTASPTTGFTRLAAAQLPAEAGETAIAFPPARAKYVKLVIASSYDAGVRPQLGEVEIYEAADAPSIVADVPHNLLLPALGGSLVRFTSQDGDGEAYRLVDGEIGDRTGWSSGTPPPGAPQFPQELTFAFRGQRAAQIERVVIEPMSGVPFYSGPLPNTTTWARTIEVQVSDSPWDGFATVQTVAVSTDGKPIAVPIGRAVRFLRLRILDNHGGDRTTLGEVRAFEAVGGPSVLAGREVPLVRADASAVAAGGETAVRREREPNDTRAQADRLDAPGAVGGALSPAGDRDVFLVPGSGAAGGVQTLTASVEGRPAIRARVSVIDSAGVTRYELDPSRTAGPRKTFSVVTAPGDLVLQVVQPPAAQAVVYDSSGSMEHRVADLDAALHAYLAQLAPTDRVQLIRFDDTIEPLMKQLSSDRAALAAALKDKVYANGGTSIYDAIGKASDALSEVSGSRAIVLLTDGEDTTSTTDPSAFWRGLERAGVRLYAIGLGNGLRNYVVRAGATAERVLANAALLTGGRYAFVADSARLGAMYREIGDEIRAPATYAIAASVATGTGTIAVTSVGDPLAVPLRVELVLDASGSMRRKLAGGAGTMMEAARNALGDVVARLPATARVALRVYGHRIPEGRPGACEDSELAVPFGALDRKRLTGRIKQVAALGTTPIAYSLTAAGEDLKAATGPAMLILVTDGKEECGGDPVAAMTALRAAGVDATLSVVGFSLTDAGDRDAMTRLATAGGGRFLDARGATALKDAVDQALAVPYVVTDATGTVVARGLVGGPSVAAPAGDLTVRLDTAATPVAVDHVVVRPGVATRVELAKDGDSVRARVAPPGSAP